MLKFLESFKRETLEQIIEDNEECLKRILPTGTLISKSIIQEHLDELANAKSIRETLEKHQDVIGKLVAHKLAGKTLWEHKRTGKPFSMVLFCFVALRLAKPDIVIETGCATGWMSALLLYALHCNKRGHLYSIDIPPVAGKLFMDWSLPEGLSPGFLVPADLRDRWTLTLGDTRQHLMPLLQEKKEVDVFFHDSDHTYQHMMWEYASAWPHIKHGGLLISDDISMNASFRDFAKGVGRVPIIHASNRNFGAFSKP